MFEILTMVLSLVMQSRPLKHVTSSKEALNTLMLKPETHEFNISGIRKWNIRKII